MPLSRRFFSVITRRLYYRHINHNANELSIIVSPNQYKEWKGFDKNNVRFSEDNS